MVGCSPLSGPDCCPTTRIEAQWNYPNVPNPAVRREELVDEEANMSGTWAPIAALPTVASGPFSSDLMIPLTDASVLVHNAGGKTGGKEWLRLTPDSSGKHETGSWSSEIDMINTREYFASGVLRDGRVYVIGGEDSDAGSDTPLGEVFDPQANGGVGAWTAIDKPTPSFD